MKILIILFLFLNIFKASTVFADPVANLTKIESPLDEEIASLDYTLENILLLVHKSLNKKLNTKLNEIRESCRTCVSTIHDKIGEIELQDDSIRKQNAGSLIWELQTIPENCYEALKHHNISNDIKSTSVNNYLFSLVKPKRFEQPFAVSCDLSVDGGGWTVIQRRQDGIEDFARNWSDYANGFGSLNGEFFIGLEKLHALTNTGWPQELYIVLEDFDGVRKYARYDKFRIGNSNSSYTLFVEGFTGDTGDDFSAMNGHKFTTFDVDNDVYKGNCAVSYKGGWWYTACHGSNLNGLYLMGPYPAAKYAQGVVWKQFRGYHYSLKFVQMMIRPNMRIK